ncbi:hypothetical protein L596_005934 [Steinernema carpocapsae]|uniref:CS domain-containing protein n=1 Tax=Steinernema carpocapsae TaxID=34508 RepID=A0A4U8V1V8_STECR|nr:hypothetical protein L596_005934 [Steinernema carpocapsae]
MAARNPPLKWCNTNNGQGLKITVNVSDLNPTKMKFVERHFVFQGKDADGNLYETELDLFGEVIADQLTETPNKHQLELKVPKVVNAEWPRLTSDKIKRSWIVADLLEWNMVDSDEDRQKNKDPFDGALSGTPYNFDGLISGTSQQEKEIRAEMERIKNEGIASMEKKGMPVRFDK